jgi:hypothetical protein
VEQGARHQAAKKRLRHQATPDSMAKQAATVMLRFKQGQMPLARSRQLELQSSELKPAELKRIPLAPEALRERQVASLVLAGMGLLR